MTAKSSQAPAQRNLRAGDRRIAPLALGHLDGKQLAVMVTFVMSTKLLYLFPALLVETTGTAAWMSLLVATAAGLVGLWGWLKWIEITGAEIFVSSLRRTVGRPVGDLVALVIAVALLVANALNVRMFVGGAIIAIVPEFPIDPLLTIGVMAGIYAAWLGLEPVARTAVLIFVPSVLSLVFVFWGMGRTFHFEHLTPLWGYGLTRTVTTGLMGAGIYGAAPMLGVLKSYVRKHEEIGAYGTAGLLAAAALLLVTLVFVVGVYVFPVASRQVAPMIVMARAVTLGRFAQRLEALYTFTWFFASSVQASILFVVVLIILAQVCGTHTYRPFVPSIAVLTFGIAGLPIDTLQAGLLVERLFTRTTGTAFMALGWILYGIGRLRGVRPKKDSESSSVDDSHADTRSESESTYG